MMQEQIAELTANLSKLPPSDVGFASSLIAQYSRFGHLTDRQVPYVSKLLAVIRGEIKPLVEIGDVSGIIALLKESKRRFPKIKLVIGAPECYSVTLKLAGQRSRHTGSLHVLSSGPDHTYFGVIFPNGRFDCRVGGTMSKLLVAALRELAIDPAGVAEKN